MHKIKAAVRIIPLLCLLALTALPLQAQDAMDASVFASARIYSHVDPADMDEIARHALEGVLPIFQASDGFIGYYVLTTDDSLMSVSLFESAEQASASNEIASDSVAEHIASLLPESPLIIQGPVGLQMVVLSEGMDTPSPSFATVRIYSDVDNSGVDAANELAEEILLPQFQDIDGFFAQHTLHSETGMTFALSVTRTAAAADAADEAGRAFSAEHLTEILPGAPTSYRAQVRVAALADLHEGANLVDEAMSADPYVGIRVYTGVNLADMAAIVQSVNEGFLPIISAADGFIAYFLLPADDTLAAINIFETAEAADAANAAAADFVAENIAPLLPNAPSILQGQADVRFFAPLDGMLDASDVTVLYASLRNYDYFDLTDRPEAAELVRTIFVPIQQQMTGFFGYFSMNDGVDKLSAFSVFDTEANALAANDEAAAFVAEYMTRWDSDEPTRINGQLGVAALAGVDMGANLIDMMDDA